MKNECDIVKDLLFSYNDNVLSTASKELVEQHLKNCENCKNILNEIKQDHNEQKQIKEIDFLKKIKKKLFNKNVIIVIGIILLVLIIVFNILVFSNYKKIASTMEIYLKDNISEQELEDIKNKIIENSNNTEIEYVSKEQAIEIMKEKFNTKPNLLNNVNVENNPLPAFIKIKTNTKIELIVSIIKDMKGIAYISTHTNVNPYAVFIHPTL